MLAKFRIPLFLIVLVLNNFLSSMLESHSCFHKLPTALQGVYKMYPHVEHRVGLKTVLDGLEQEKRPEFLELYVWRMIINQKISHQTADQMLANLNKIFAGKPMVNNMPIDWNQERSNKLFLIEKLNCGAVRKQCSVYVNTEHSICLQEFVYGQLNPTTKLVFEGPYMSYQLVEHAACKAGCHNPKRFDIVRPGLEYYEELNHQFCSE